MAFDMLFGKNWTSDNIFVLYYVLIGICLFLLNVKGVVQSQPEEQLLQYRLYLSHPEQEGNLDAEKVDNGWDEEAEKRKYDEMFKMRFGSFVMNMYRYMFLGDAFRDGMAYLRRSRRQRATPQAVVGKRANDEFKSMGVGLDLEKNETERV
jgi:hypothetical protein